VYTNVYDFIKWIEENIKKNTDIKARVANEVEEKHIFV
jgi:hypothetical protein